MKDVDDDEFLDDYDYPDYHNGTYGDVTIPTILTDYEDYDEMHTDGYDHYEDEDADIYSDVDGVEADDEYKGN